MEALLSSTTVSANLHEKSINPDRPNTHCLFCRNVQRPFTSDCGKWVKLHLSNANERNTVGTCN